MNPNALNQVRVDALQSLEENYLDKLAAAYGRLIRSSGREMARRFRAQAQSLTASAKLWAYVGPKGALVAAGDQQFTSPDGDEVVPSDHIENGMTGPDAVRAEAAKHLVDTMSNAGIAFDVGGVFDREALGYVGKRAEAGMSMDFWHRYSGVIEDAAEGGWSIPKTADEIVTRTARSSTSEATMLARTDLVGLANHGSYQAALQVYDGREDIYKIWQATDDERTRDTHVEADGQSVPLRDTFAVGGFPLRYPGDFFGPDQEVINCRCTLLYSDTPGKHVVHDVTVKREQVTSAVENWVGAPQTMRIHMANELEGVAPSPGPAEGMAQQARALLQAVHTGELNDTVLYRGSQGPYGDPRIPASYTPSRAIAKKFAGPKGTVEKFGPGALRGIRAADYAVTGPVPEEAQWIAVKKENADPKLFAPERAVGRQAPAKPTGNPLAGIAPAPKIQDDAYGSWYSGMAVSNQAKIEGMSPEEYEKAITEKLRRDLAQAPVVIRTPGSVAVEITKDGRFQSQFESGTSKGLLDYEVRKSGEANLFSYPKDLPVEQRPIYGYLGGITKEGEYGVGSYGPVAFELKPEVRERTTFTGRDSLSLLNPPTPLSDPKAFSVRTAMERTSFALRKPLEEWSTEYWEAQIHGGVKLEDVARITIWYDPRQDKYLRAAERTREDMLAEIRKKGLTIPVELKPYNRSQLAL
jgi:hypothetical protein